MNITPHARYILASICVLVPTVIWLSSLLWSIRREIYELLPKTRYGWLLTLLYAMLAYIFIWGLVNIHNALAQ